MPPPVRFDAFVDAALYGPEGFYSARGRAGRGDGDFTTSVETSTLFGECVARWLDDTWRELEEPDELVVIEAGSGPGRLCRDVLLSVDGCRDAIRYVMVERSEQQRAEAYDRVVASCFSDRDEAPVAALADLPIGRFTGIVLANELLDNLAPRLFERADDGWDELYVDRGRLVAQPAEDAAVRMASALAPDAQPGDRIPLQLKASVWLSRAQRLLERGRVLVFDYGVERTAELAARDSAEWLRGYRGHRRVADLLAEPGGHDITCEVAFDQLGLSRPVVRQREWLMANGLDDLTADARARWQLAAAAPDAAAVAARAVVDEAAQLIAPDGLGGFLVAEWSVDQPTAAR